MTRATSVREVLQSALRILHDDAFMQHGMICLYDTQRAVLTVEALHQADEQLIASGSQVRYLSGEGLVGTVLSQHQPLVLLRVADDQRFLDRLGLYDYNLPFIAVPLFGVETQPIGVLAAQPMAHYEEHFQPARAFWKRSPIWWRRRCG